VSVALLTNNPAWHRLAAPWRPWEPSGPPDSAVRQSLPRQCFLLEGSPLKVLLAGRSLLHAGWRLLHHPLYGNFRPHQQPYRTLIWRREKIFLKAGPALTTDYWSLRLLEEALALYQNSRVPGPQETTPAFREDFALLDMELLRPAFKEAGWPEQGDSLETGIT